MQNLFTPAVFFLACCSLLSAELQGQAAGKVAGKAVGDIPAFTVRPGYKVTLAAENLGEARFMANAPSGGVLLSQPNSGIILLLRDLDNDGTFETRVPFVENEKAVHSMFVKDGWVYFTSSEQGAVKRARDTNADGRADETVVVTTDLPQGGGHPTWGIAVSDSHVFVAVSDPSNMEAPPTRSTIYSFALGSDGKASDKQIFATGIRNTLKLQFRIDSNGESTDELWGADHGSDNFGTPFGDRKGNQPITDLNPPDELNHYVQDAFYGHPFITGLRIPRQEFVGKRDDLHQLAARTTVPEFCYGAHWAANGFTFLSSSYFTGGPLTGHRGDLIQAFHGSWNSSVRVGYCVARVLFDPMTGKPFGLMKIVDGIDAGNNRFLTRPVDVIEAPDGTLLFTDNQAQRIYRISKE